MNTAERRVVDDALGSGTNGRSRAKQPMATLASPPASGTQSVSRMIRPRTCSERAATMTNLVP